jgi:hypothetical protein
MKRWFVMGLFGVHISLSEAANLTPLADYPIGTNTTGQIILSTAKMKSSGNVIYIGTVKTGKGDRTYPVILPKNTNPFPLLGNKCIIWAKIERDNRSKWGRKFRVTKIIKSPDLSK